MGTIGEGFLYRAIHSEIIAREAYKSISEKIESTEGREVMLAMSAEEDRHREILADRFLAVTGKNFLFDPEQKPGPDFSFIEKSAFSRTDALDALSLCLGAEIDAINYYNHELGKATERPDVKMLKSLVKFEKKHKTRLEKEIRRLRETNHWLL